VAVSHEVVIIGQQGNDAIIVVEVADMLGTIPYEVVPSIAARVPRVAIGSCVQALGC
jgi:alanine racemase